MLTFSYEPVSKRITRIYGFLTEMMYLVEGDEEVALIDTGSGLGSLKKVVDEILLLHGSQDKSIKVLLTHGHIDHALGAWEFDKIGIPVYMNRVDDYVYRTNSQDSFREAFMPLTDFEGHGVYENEDYIPAAPLEHFHNLTENDSFDLGNVTITAYECPGHTKGSMTFLIKENDGDSYLFTGDAGNGFTFLYQNYSTSVEEYEESLKSLKEKVETIAKEIYGADGVTYEPAAEKMLAKLTDLGFGDLPVCMAKTQYSLSDDQTKLGRPEGFNIHVRDAFVNAGAGFVVILTGAIMTMPGLPKKPAAFGIDVDDNGKITGLF